MSDYTPTTEEIREYIETGGEPRPWVEIDDVEEAREKARGEAFDRWLAAHDAEVRASVGAEEPEWEYGAQHSQGTNPHPSRKHAEERVAWHASGDSRKRPEARGKARLVRRRKAGPWVPVEREESES